MSPGKTGDTDKRRDREPGTHRAAATTMRVSLPAVPVSDSLIRDRMRRWLHALCWPRGQLGDILLAVSEAVSNSIEHAYPPRAPGQVEVEGLLRTDPDGYRWIEVTVRDYGCWRPTPPHTENRRRGIPLMRACVDEVTIEGTDRGTEIRLRSCPVPPAVD